MANTIKLKRGSGSDPSASDLAVGEVALRTDNAKLFTKNDAGNVAQIGGGLSDVVDDSTPQLGGDLDVNTNNIIFGDSGGASDDRLTFGAGTDLSIYHNGTDSAIVNSTGDLYITNNGDDLLLQALDDVVIKTQGGADVSIQCFGNGGVELYADNNKRFETSGDGATLTGNLTVSGTVDGRDVATDGTKLDGIESNATADQTAAEIKTLLNSNQLEAAQIANNAITAGKLPNSEVTFAKIQDVPQNRIAGRISSGSGVLQELTAANVRSIINVEDGATADQSASEIVALIADQTIAPSTIDMEDSEKIKLGTGDDLEIYHDGSSSYISDVGTGSLKITTNGTGVDIQKGSSETIARFIADGAVELYYDNVKTFHTKQNGIVVEGTEGAGAILEFRADEGDNNADYFRFYADPTNSDLYLQNYTSGSWETNARYTGNGSTELWYDNSKKFETTSGGAEITGSLNLTSELNFTGNGNKQIDFATLNGSNTITLRHQDGGSFETAASFTANGGASITHNGSTKIQTTSSGISITGNATSSVSSLSDSSTITVNFASASHFTVTLGGNRTFGDPSSTSNSIGSSGSIFIVQDGTGGRTASFHSDYKFAGGTAPTLSTAANAVDRLDFVVRAADNIHCVVTLDVK